MSKEKLTPQFRQKETEAALYLIDKLASEIEVAEGVGRSIMKEIEDQPDDSREVLAISRFMHKEILDKAVHQLKLDIVHQTFDY